MGAASIDDVRINTYRPGLGFLGPMLGSNPGWVTSQGEILARLFRAEGYQVAVSSTQPHRIRRGFELLAAPVMWGKTIDIAVVMVFSGLGFIQALLSTALLPRHTRVVTVLHGGNLPNYANERPRLVRYLLDKADAIVAPSGFNAEWFSKLGYEVRVIPNVLQIDQYPFRHRTKVAPTLLWMRAFKDLYAPQTAVYALRHLKESFPEARLTMAGQDCGLQREVQALAAELEVADSVRFPGFLDTAGKQVEFDCHDIYLHTNLIDNMPVSVLEAAAFGTPVVATKVGGIAHLLEHERNALLVEPSDPAAMAEQVRRLLLDAHLAARLSSAGRALAVESSWAEVKARWEDLFEELR